MTIVFIRMTGVIIHITYVLVYMISVLNCITSILIHMASVLIHMTVILIHMTSRDQSIINNNLRRTTRKRAQVEEIVRHRHHCINRSVCILQLQKVKFAKSRRALFSTA